MSETKRERYIRILSGLGGADISSEACKELVELLKEQPETAAQTAESAQNVSNEDLISRKAAIDAAKAHWYKPDIAGAIEQLPSAQPERTCVNCGRTVNNGGWYADGRTRCPIEEHYALPKDGYCHLWEKRNVTDDDYPERREE